MQTTTLSSKGQVIIPKALRVARRWGPGTQLELHDTPEGVLLRPAAERQKVVLCEGLAAIRQRVAYAGPVVTLAQMDAEVLQQAASQSASQTASKLALQSASQAPSPRVRASKPVPAAPRTAKRAAKHAG
jgi:AbrB family looped-hinge helix DNA binding protein